LAIADHPQSITAEINCQVFQLRVRGSDHDKYISAKKISSSEALKTRLSAIFDLMFLLPTIHLGIRVTTEKIFRLGRQALRDQQIVCKRFRGQKLQLRPLNYTYIQ
jgi:hypothetical protein